MIDHLTLTVKNGKKSVAFYKAALKPLGYGLQMKWEKLWGFGENKKPVLWIKEAKPVTTPQHIAFYARDRKQVDGFYKAAIKAGGKDNGKPGLRAEYHPSYYGAFVIEPDGHPFEAVCHR